MSRPQHHFPTSVILRIAIWLIAGVWCAPILLAAVAALRAPKRLAMNPGDILGGEPTFESFIALQRSGGGDWLRNSLIVSAIAAIVTLLCSLPLAADISRKSPISRRLSDLLMLTYVVPTSFLSFPVLYLAVILSLRDSLVVLGILSAATSLPLAVMVLQAQAGTAAGQLMDIAALERLSLAQRTWHVIIPTVGHSVLAIAAIAFVLAWSEYAYSLLLLSSRLTLSIGLPHLLSGDVWRWSELLAAVAIVGLPALFLADVVTRLVNLLRLRQAGV